MIRYTIYCSWVSTRWQWFLHLYMKGKNSDILREKQCSSHNTKWKERHKTVKKKKDDNNLDGLKHDKGQYTLNKQFKDKYANSGATYYTVTLVHNYK